MSRAPEPGTEPSATARPKRARAKSGADTEPRSDLTGRAGGRDPATTDPTKITSDAAAERVERRRAWARERVKAFPPWSYQQWREANAALGYRLRERE